jgi:hypothetical protein
VENGPQIVIFGDSATIEGQQGRIFESHHGETGHEDIGEPDRGIPLARVCHALKASVQGGHHGIPTQILADPRCCWCPKSSIFHGDYNYRGFEAESPVKSESIGEKNQETISRVNEDNGSGVYETLRENFMPEAVLERLRELLT